MAKNIIHNGVPAKKLEKFELPSFSVDDIINDTQIVFNDRMMFSPVCSVCKHYRISEGYHCDAFPDTDIPAEIWNGDNQHFRPVEGDNGIIFSPDIKSTDPLA